MRAKPLYNPYFQNQQKSPSNERESTINYSHNEDPLQSLVAKQFNKLDIRCLRNERNFEGLRDIMVDTQQANQNSLSRTRNAQLYSPKSQIYSPKQKTSQYFNQFNSTPLRRSRSRSPMSPSGKESKETDAFNTLQTEPTEDREKKFNKVNISWMSQKLLHKNLFNENQKLEKQISDLRQEKRDWDKEQRRLHELVEFYKRQLDEKQLIIDRLVQQQEIQMNKSIEKYHETLQRGSSKAVSQQTNSRLSR